MPPTRADEAAILTGASIFSEWRAARGCSTANPGEELAAIARFARLDPALGWAGNLRARPTDRLAVRRGARSWSFRALADDDTAWADAAGSCATGTFDALVAAVADHVLRADTRPDDVLAWTGNPGDPWPWGALILGAAIDFTR